MKIATNTHYRYTWYDCPYDSAFEETLFGSELLPLSHSMAL